MAKDAHDSVTKDEPGSPKNVGKSTTGRGEDVVKKHGKEPGRYEAEEKGESGRPAGKSTMRDQTGVNPTKPKS
ncbi:MAG TPA: hypothetical protein VIA62_29870 [Thermoanaerobaculia bacterium]|jgi:hypothetical protein|nr:hypothetical protein [Thermoanaerobaculia bacterium]